MFEEVVNKSKLFLLGVSILLLLLSLYLFSWLSLSTNHMSTCPLVLSEMWNLEMSFHFPMFAKIFSLIVIMITSSVFMFTYDYLRADGQLYYFIMLLITFVLSMLALIFIPNIILLMLGWDGLGLSSYLLVIFFGSKSSLSSGMLTVLSNRVGDSFMVMAIGLSFMSTTFLAVDYLSLSLVGGAFVLIASFTKSAQTPFSAWLPAAMAAPTPVSALVHSSTLVTAGVYLVFSFSPTLYKIESFSSVVYFVGVITCFLASLAALFETDLKKVIALSTLSQLGVMFLSLGMNLPWFTFFHMIMHAVFKALLFISAGVFIMNSGPQDMRYMGNMWYIMPWTSMIFLTSVMALSGLPFLSGFYSKDLIVESLFLTTKPFTTAVLCYFSILLTSAYSFRMLNMLLWSPSKGSSVFVTGGESNFTISSYIPLGLLVVAGGPSLLSYSNIMGLWNTTMPFFLKLMTVLGLSFSAIGGLKLSQASFTSASFSNIGWLCFLNPFVISSNIGSLGWIKEKTWMESLSGVGISKFYVKPPLAKFHNFSFQDLMTLMGIFTLMLTAW